MAVALATTTATTATEQYSMAHLLLDIFAAVRHCLLELLVLVHFKEGI
jgi:hypothetical protein